MTGLPDLPTDELDGDGHQSVVIPYTRTGEGAATREPVRTLTTRDRLALIVPPMGGVELRDASTAPAPTQTTTTRAGLVTAEDAT